MFSFLMCVDKIDVLYTSRINKYHLNCRAIWRDFPFALLAADQLQSPGGSYLGSIRPYLVDPNFCCLWNIQFRMYRRYWIEIDRREVPENLPVIPLCFYNERTK